jgi:hypothetical protein
MMRLCNGGYQPPQTQQPGIFGNNMQPPAFNMPMPPANFPHNNVAQFGSTPQQFYGQSCPPPNYPSYPNSNPNNYPNSNPNNYPNSNPNNN